jgi:hypothetical protein
MAQSQRVLRQEETAINIENRHGRHKLAELDSNRVAKHLVLFHPDEAGIADLMAKARTSIPGLGKTETILNVLRRDQGHMYGLARKSRFDPSRPAGDGFVMTLLLNEIGLMQLALGSFNGPDPDLRLLAKPGERPAGIYIWCVYAPGPLAAGVALFM